jgi:hypothetical protein
MIEYSLDKINTIKANINSPVFTGQVFIPEGTATAPGLVFQNDDVNDTGLYHISDGSLGVTCNGNNIATFTQNKTIVNGNLLATNQIFVPEGTNTAPGLVFQNDGAPDTGLYHVSDGSFSATCNTTPVVNFTPNGVNLLQTPTAPTAVVYSNTTQIATTAFVVREKGGRRNYIINGNFDKWDYSTSQTAYGYGSDNRWANNNNGSTKTHSQVACGDTERALFNAMYFSRTKVSSSSGSSNYVHKWQAIENINLLAGKTVTLSFWAKADDNRNIAIEFEQNFGTGGNPSSPVSGIGSQLVALTTSWQKFSITFTLPSIVGKTLGSDGVQTTLTRLLFWFDAGSNYNTRAANLGQQSGTFDIAQVKLEDGSGATNGWHPYDGEFGGEIEACQRYLNIFSGIRCNFNGYDKNVYFSNQLNYTTMRVVPSITSSLSNVSYTSCENLRLEAPTINSAKLISDTTAATANAHFEMGSGDYFMLSAEL